MSFIAELKRRNVIRTAVAYLAAAWLLIQVFESLLPVFGWPDSSIRYVFIALGIGFIPVMFAAWVFELTPEGLMRDSGDSRIDQAANRRFDRVVIGILALAVTLFAVHTFIIDPDRDAARIEQAARDARSGAFKESFGEKSIAVLPFNDWSGDPEQEYFGVGIAEELLNLLAKVEGLRVISRTSSFQFQDSKLSVAEIADRLDVATVLEGSFRRSDDKLRITAQLIDAHADAHLWSETYDREFEDVFQIQDEVAAEVVEQLKITLAVGLPKVERHDPEAYRLYLRAKHILDMDDPDRVDIAEELLLRALDIEFDYIDAEVMLALAYHRKASITARNGNVDLALEFLDKRTTILARVSDKAPNNAHLNAMLGFGAMLEDGDHGAAARHIEAAIEAEPRNYQALMAAGVLADHLGRTELTIRIFEYMTRRDPMGFWGHSLLASAYLSKGEIDKAISAFKSAEAISPKTGGIQWKYGFALLMNGEPKAALERLELEEHLPYQLHGKVLALHDLGDHEGAATALAHLLQIKDNPDDPENRWDFGLARAYAWLGDADSAFKYLYLEQGSGPGTLLSLAQNPYFVKIKDDPRWQPLVDSIEQEASKIQFNPKLPPEILALQ